MSDRVCIRGCTKRGVHYATCGDYGLAEAFEQAKAAGVPGVSYVPQCTGCAPVECREGSYWCDRCFGRARRLLDDAPDLLGRLRSLIDPSKAQPMDQVRIRVSSTDPAAAVASDPLDAIGAVEAVLDVWYLWQQNPATDALRLISNDLEAARWMGAHVLDRHPESDGLREAWSVQDAVDRWGVERVPAKGERPWEPDDDAREEIVTPSHEWGDALLNQDEAVQRYAGTARTLRRWRAEGLTWAGEIFIAGRRTTLYRESELREMRELMSKRVGGRPS